jgi:hypothetical protein
LQVRRNKVLSALQYLVQHNHLYRDLSINHGMMDNWHDEFIPLEIWDNIVCLEESDHLEREGYTVSLEPGNYENDLHAAQDRISQPQATEPLMTGSVCTDVNTERQDPNARLINTLFSVVTGNQYPTDETTEDTTPRQEPRPENTATISYVLRGQLPLISDYKDPHYFTGAFPTLFPNGIGGHQDKRTIQVSLVAFADWALNHHSRRCVDAVGNNMILISPTDLRGTRRLCTSYTTSFNSAVLLWGMHSW